MWEAGLDVARGRGACTLAARPSEAETRLSLAALADLLEGVDRSLVESLPPPQRDAIEVALLRARPRGHPPEARAIAAGFLAILRNASASSQVVVAIDDAQWLDAASADALSFAARRLADAPVSFLVTERSGSTSTFVRTLERHRLERIGLPALSLGATRHLLAERLGLDMSRRTLRSIFAAARGNPLFSLELGRLILATGGTYGLGEEIPVPKVVDDLLGSRVAGLTDESRVVVLGIALAGDLRRTQVEQLTIHPHAVDEAVEAGLLTADGEGVRVAHPLVAAVARRRARPSERRAVHRALAGVVSDEELRARHLALATTAPDAALAELVAAAAAAAAARGAVEDAVELAEQSLRLTPTSSTVRVDRLLALAQSLEVAGEPRRVTELLLPEIEQLPAGAPSARAHLLLADNRWIEASVEVYVSHLEQALVEGASDPALRATAMARKARYMSVCRAERLPAAEALALAALPDAQRAGSDVEREVLHALAWARVLRGKPIADLRSRFSSLSNDAVHLFRSLDRAVAAQVELRGDLPRARAILQGLVRLADERGEMLSYVVLRLQLCELELRAGDWDTAERLLDEWHESPDTELSMRPAYERSRAAVAAGRGDPEGAERLAGAAIAGSEARGWTWDTLEALRVSGIAALLAHQPERAAATLRRVWEHTRKAGIDDPGVLPVAPDLVEALVQIGEQREAERIVEWLSVRSREQRHRWGVVTTRRARALVRLSAREREDEAVADLATVAADYARLGFGFDASRSLLLLGTAERRRRHWGAARQALDRSAESFDRLGSPGWARRVRDELARVGARRPRAAGQLTPTERRVTDLAATGLSNKEIARALVVSVHTIEVHLSRSYAKLGIRSRGQLGGVVRGG